MFNAACVSNWLYIFVLIWFLIFIGCVTSETPYPISSANLVCPSSLSNNNLSLKLAGVNWEPNVIEDAGGRSSALKDSRESIRAYRGEIQTPGLFQLFNWENIPGERPRICNVYWEEICRLVLSTKMIGLLF